MDRIGKVIPIHLLLVAIILFQLLWLIVIWVTGTSANAGKLPLLITYSIVAGLIVMYLPVSTIAKAKARILSNWKRSLLVTGLIIFLIGIAYARYQRGWTWDEEFSLEAARIVAEDGIVEFFDQYADIPWLGTQHPPLVPLVNGFIMRLFGVDLLVIRITSMVFALGTIVITYYLGLELYDRLTGIIAALVLLSFPLIFRLGTAALTDIQVTFFFALSLLLVFQLMRKPSHKVAVMLGLAVGAGFLSKYTMGLILPVFLSYFLMNNRFRRLFPYLFVAGFIAVLLASSWLLFANSIGVLDGQRNTIDINPGWFVRDAGGLKFLSNSLLTRLTSAFGPYNIPVVFFGALLILRRRKQSDQFIILWISTVVISLIITLPDHRYFMPIFPALALMMALWLKTKPETMERAVLLLMLYAAGAMWLFVDWYRVEQLFVG